MCRERYKRAFKHVDAPPPQNPDEWVEVTFLDGDADVTTPTGEDAEPAGLTGTTDPYSDPNQGPQATWRTHRSWRCLSPALGPVLGGMRQGHGFTPFFPGPGESRN